MKKAIIGYALSFMAGSILAGGSVFAATNMVQAQKGTSTIQLNGNIVSKPPKLVYGGTTYVQLYSIQQGLKTVLGTKPTWDGTNFNIVANSQLSNPIPPSSDTIGLSQLPFTYKSANGMVLTINSIQSTSGGLTMNITMQNNGATDGDSMTTTWNILAGGTKYENVNQDQVFYDNFDTFHPTQTITGNTTFAALPFGTNQFTLYFTLQEGINFDNEHITFDLSK